MACGIDPNTLSDEQVYELMVKQVEAMAQARKVNPELAKEAREKLPNEALMNTVLIDIKSKQGTGTVLFQRYSEKRKKHVALVSSVNHILIDALGSMTITQPHLGGSDQFVKKQ